MLRSGALASEAELKRFRGEARAAARLHRPNLVAIHEVGVRGNTLMFCFVAAAIALLGFGRPP